MFRTFLAPPNWLGFEWADFVLLGAAVLILALRRVEASRHIWRELARRPAASMSLLFVLPIALRLSLLGRYPVPIPAGADDFGYLLLADTLRHLRLANPPHAYPEFFEQVFVLQRPSYSSMFNLGQGLVLALGWTLFGHPWAGVLLSVGALCALIYWMLCGWTTPSWALAGGLLGVMLFGPLSYWTNSYWGGAVPACAGCLIFGALPRLRNRPHRRYAFILGIGLALHLLARPFEFFFLLFSAAAYLLVSPRRLVVAWALMPLALACGLILLHNERVTGSWTTLPYRLYRYQYGTPATFTFQPNPVPHQALNGEKEADYRAESAIHGDGDSAGSYIGRLLFRLRFLRFFVFAPLYPALLAFILSARHRRYLWLTATILLFLLGSNFYPYFYPHYIAALASLLLLASLLGLRRFPRAAPILLALCAAEFISWFGLYAFGNQRALAVVSTVKGWDFIDYGDPQGRIGVADRLARAPGKHIVFVHYAPEHRFEEWIHNDADIDSSRVIWVHDLGPSEDRELVSKYAGRHAWLLQPDVQPPKLEPLTFSQGPFQDIP